MESEHGSSPQGYFGGHAEHEGRVFQIQSGIQINAENFNASEFFENATFGGIRNFHPLDISAVDPIDIGVHRSEANHEGTLPEYVPRSVDAILRKRVSNAQKYGGFVLLVGDSTAGKSRSAFEALLATAPACRIWSPADGRALIGGLRELAEARDNCFLWLDDLERYIGPDGLTPATLSVMKHFRVPVVATIRAEQYRRLSPGEGSKYNDEQRHIDIGSRVLQQLDAIILPRLWDDEELNSAREVPDGRITNAVAHSNLFGVAEYLASGPRLYQEWAMAWGPGGNPRGAAIVAAAIDCVRAGITSPVPLSFLMELHETYLDRAGGDLLRPESPADALDWASRRRYGVTSLLLPIKSGSHYRVFDYLPDTLARSNSAHRIPSGTWKAVLQYAQAAGLSFHVGMAAVQHEEWCTAEHAWKSDVERNPVPARINLGRLYLKTKRKDQAKSVWQEAVDLGSVDASIFLGGVYENEGRLRQAIDLYRIGATKGDSHAIQHLAYALTDEKESIRWWLKIADADESGRIAFNLGVLYQRLGDMAASKQWWLTSAENGNNLAMHSYGIALREDGRESEGLSWVKKAADSENPNAMATWAEHLNSQGRNEEADSYLERALSLDDTSVLSKIGYLRMVAGDLAKAEEHWRRGYEAGDRRCAFNLGVRLQETGDLSGAEDAYRLASHAGHAGAAYNYAFMLVKDGDHEEAVIQFRYGLKSAKPADICEFGHALFDRHLYKEALPWLNLAILKGHTHSACLVGQIFLRAGLARNLPWLLEDGERLFRIALSGGHKHAGKILSSLLVRTGRGAEAAAVMRRTEIGGVRRPRRAIPGRKALKRKKRPKRR